MIIQIRQHDDEWKSYELIDLHSFTEKLSLNQLMAFNRELALSNISAARSMADVLKIMADIFKASGSGKLKPAEMVAHPEGIFLVAVMVWGARTYAGETCSLLEACDFALEDMRFIPDSTDAARVESLGKGSAHA